MIFPKPFLILTAHYFFKCSSDDYQLVNHINPLIVQLSVGVNKQLSNFNYVLCIKVWCYPMKLIVCLENFNNYQEQFCCIWLYSLQFIYRNSCSYRIYYIHSILVAVQTHIFITGIMGVQEISVYSMDALLQTKTPSCKYISVKICVIVSSYLSTKSTKHVF